MYIGPSRSSGHIISVVPIVKGILLARGLLGLSVLAMDKPVSHPFEGNSEPVSHFAHGHEDLPGSSTWAVRLG
jgi:hypothetical protein